jgi:hypothetical protein
MWRPLLVTALLTTSCRADRPAGAALRLRGPLAPLAVRAPATLAGCAADSTRYSPPFRAWPYRLCAVETSGGHEFIQVDADSVLTQAYFTSRVSRAEREVRFREWEREMARVLGPGRRCGPRTVEWRRGDSLHAVLQVAPESDVGPEASPTWRITRLMRLGPLDPTTWACKPFPLSGRGDG